MPQAHSSFTPGHKVGAEQSAALLKIHSFLHGLPLMFAHLSCGQYWVIDMYIYGGNSAKSATVKLAPSNGLRMIPAEAPLLLDPGQRLLQCPPLVVLVRVHNDLLRRYTHNPREPGWCGAACN